MERSSIRWQMDEGGIVNNNNDSSKDFDIQLSMIPPVNNDTSTTNPEYVEESTFIRTDSLKSSSFLRLADNLSQNILLHPFIALRRTCQVNRKCSPFICIQPFSLISFMYHQQRKQGITALYKGLSSELLVKGITLGSMTALANHADWPTEVNSKRYFEDSAKVVILRGISVALTTPFICSSVIETVQSVIVVKDRPAFVDCLKEGFFRLLHLKLTPSNRIIPIWLLILPTVFYYISHSALKHIAGKVIDLFKSNMFCNNKKIRTRSEYANSSQANLKSIYDTTWQQEDLTTNHDSMDCSNIEFNEIESDSSKISTAIIASFVADVALLPMETVLNSLYIQGTRTIIDNCDETTVVLPVLTNYDGFADCYQSILRFEGNLGLYKGLGAIIMQYSAHFLIFRSLYYLLREFQFNRGGFSNTGSISARRNKSIRQVRPEIMRHIQSTRHSTPNNPMTGINRLDENDYRTPRRYDRL